MDQDDQFQAVLPSNSSMTYFPSNKPNNFTTQFPLKYNLEGEWEAALIDVQYPYPSLKWKGSAEVAVLVTTKNERPALDDDFDQMIYQYYFANHSALPPAVIPNHPKLVYKDNQITVIPAKDATASALKPEQASLVLFEKNGVISVTPGDKFSYYRFTFEPGHFNSISQLCEKFNYQLLDVYTKTIKTAAKPPTLTYNDAIDRLWLTSGDEFATILTDDEPLRRRFGIPTQTIYRSDKKLAAWASYPTKDTRGDFSPQVDLIQSMFVYSDIIKYQTVGDVQAPLLGVLPVKGESKHQSYWACQPPYYIPIVSNNFNTINIRLCTDSGDPFPLVDNGKVICRLHFRRKRLV